MVFLRVRVTLCERANAILTEMGPEWIKIGRDAMPWLVDGAAMVAVVGCNGRTTSEAKPKM